MTITPDTLMTLEAYAKISAADDVPWPQTVGPATAARSRTRKSSIALRKPGLGMKCADCVITGS